ncbi:HCP-like protein [Gigaspora margarita]|uniref:HCP-like protein n=1 Tax=Gigaspora margarita TaxID=4874 RepID=A0A8H4AZ18_GIGMA|nr:HCP-like protein [Gigaspora margarita]
MKKASEYYYKAAYWYENGIKNNDQKAFELYRKAADMGHAEGIFKVDAYYERGSKAADMGHAERIFKVDGYYERGSKPIVKKNKNTCIAAGEYYETANLDDVIEMSQVARYFRGRKRLKKIEPLVFDFRLIIPS